MAYLCIYDIIWNTGPPSQMWLCLYKLKSMNYTTQSLVIFSNWLEKQNTIKNCFENILQTIFSFLTTLDYNFIDFVGNLENCVLDTWKYIITVIDISDTQSCSCIIFRSVKIGQTKPELTINCEYTLN